MIDLRIPRSVDRQEMNIKKPTHTREKYAYRYIITLILARVRPTFWEARAFHSHSVSRLCVGRYAFTIRRIRDRYEL